MTFDTAADHALAAVEKSQTGQRSERSLIDELASIRRPCKEIMVCLETHGQHVLAARIEREYERFKQTCRARHLADSKRARHEVADAAAELCATMAALKRFQNHIAQAAPPNRDPSNGEQEAAPTKAIPSHKCRIDRGVVTDQRLRELFQANLAKYKRVGRQILAGDTVSKTQFSAEFGSMVLAQKWAEEEGRADDHAEINRWGTAIRSSSFYRTVFQPFTGREVRVPDMWQSILGEDARCDDIIHEASLMSDNTP